VEKTWKEIKSRTEKTLYKIQGSQGFKYEKLPRINCETKKGWKEIDRQKTMNIYVNGVLIEI